MKSIQAYESQGLHVNYVTLNNEPTFCKIINYPSILLITPSDMATMLKNYWFPAFKANHLTTKILLLDFNWNSANLVEPLLKDEAIRASPFVGGVAWHGYGGDVAVQSEIHDRYGGNNSLLSGPALAGAAASRSKTWSIWCVSSETGERRL